MSEAVDYALHYEISKFYNKEARLFNKGDYRTWIDTMVDPGIRYYLPIFEDRYSNDKRPPAKFMPFVYDDNYGELEARIRQLETGLGRRIEPPARIRHLITNLEAFHTEVDGEFEVLTNFLVCRNRREHEQVIMVGGREDRIRREGNDYRLLSRTIHIPQRVIQDADLYYMM